MAILAVTFVITCILVASAVNTILADPGSKVSIIEKSAETCMTGTMGAVKIEFTVQNSATLGCNLIIKFTVIDPQGVDYIQLMFLHLEPGQIYSDRAWIDTDIFDTGRPWSYDCTIDEVRT